MTHCALLIMCISYSQLRAKCRGTERYNKYNKGGVRVTQNFVKMGPTLITFDKITTRLR